MGCQAVRCGWLSCPPKGVANFVLDHSIVMGDLLVFHYLRVGHFLVEVFGKSGCPKLSNVKSMDERRTSETSKSYIPVKHPSDSYEQPSNKRHWDFPSSESVKEPPVRAKNVPTRVHIRERSPTAVPLADTHVDSCFMTSPEKGMPNLGPEAETPVDPCFTNQDEYRPKDIPSYETMMDPCLTTNTSKVVPGADTLVEPCFITSRDNSFIEVGDGNRLFDLSVFEMPDNKSTINMEEETHYPLDLPVYDLPENETNANRTVELQKSETGITDKKSVINQDVEDYLPASIGFPTCEVFKRCTKEVLPESCQTELLSRECAPLSSSSPKVALTIDSKIIGEQKTSEFAAVSGKKSGLNNQETRVYSQEFCGNAEGESSLGNTSGLNSGVLGGTMKNIEQEPRDVKHDIFYSDAMVSSSFDGIISTSDHISFSCGDLAENSKGVVIIEANDYPTAMLEPADCNASFATDVEVICSVSGDSEIFSVLPDPFPVAAKVYRYRGIKHKHQLIFLRDNARRLWPVVYHQRNSFKALTSGWTKFMKSYNVQHGDKCIFTAENMEGTTLTVKVVQVMI